MNNLYPPIIPTYMPAFNYASPCKIYFSLSPYNTVTEMNTSLVQVTLKHQTTNSSAFNGTLYPNGIKLCQLMYDSGLEQYYIEIQPTDVQNNYFNIDEYYKVQIRFTSNEVTVVPEVCTDAWVSANLQHFSEWSTVCLIQSISNVNITYTNEDLVPYTSYENAKTRPYAEYSYPEITLVGSINFYNSHNLNITEKDSIKHYTVRVLNIVDSSTPTELYNSGPIYVNHNDISNKIYYNIPYIFQEQTAYIIRIDVVTNFLYAFSNYLHIYIAENQSTLVADITATLDNANGLVTVNVTSDDASATEKKLIIRRKSSKNNFSTWEDMYTFTGAAASVNKSFVDKTAEAGIWYYYGVQNEIDNVRSATISTDKPVMPIYEDVFLTANDQILRVRFDQSVDNFGITTAEGKQEPIGSQYPFISKNGTIFYKTFNLSGLIVSLMDGVNGIDASKQSIYGENYNRYAEFNDENDVGLYNDYIYERNFREKVIQFLHKTQVKLFRSTTEGNILVKLTNISFTPKKELSRLVYSFSCTVTEIDEDNIKNDIKYHIYNNQE